MITWNNVIDVVKEATPLLGAAISAGISSVNPVGGMAISLISKAFGANKDDPEDILNKINGDPEYKLKLKKIEFEHEESLRNFDSEDYQTEVDDRKSARDFQIRMHSFIPTFLAIGYFIIYAVIQFYCLAYPAQTNDLISARLHDGFMVVLAYFFGRNHEQFMKSKD